MPLGTVSSARRARQPAVLIGAALLALWAAVQRFPPIRLPGLGVYRDAKGIWWCEKHQRPIVPQKDGRFICRDCSRPIDIPAGHRKPKR